MAMIGELETPGASDPRDCSWYAAIRGAWRSIIRKNRRLRTLLFRYRHTRGLCSGVFYRSLFTGLSFDPAHDDPGTRLRFDYLRAVQEKRP
jgi:hypothetical protein